MMTFISYVCSKVSKFFWEVSFIYLEQQIVILEAMWKVTICNNCLSPSNEEEFQIKW